MGVSIHYHGRIDDPALIPKLCEEIGDIARAMGRPATMLDDDGSTAPGARLESGGRIKGNLGLKGIQFAPHPKAESLSLFFDREGKLHSAISKVMVLEGTLEPDAARVSIKTQFAGPDTHVWVIGLLKYLKKRYISNLEVYDESGYCETGDRRKLEANMTLLDDKIQGLTSSIVGGVLGDLTGLTADEIASRIEQWFQAQGQGQKQERPEPEE